MSYIDGNLLAGEKVVYRTRLHWLLFMGPVLFTVVIVLNIGRRVMGIVVDAVSDVITLTREQLHPVPEFNSAVDSAHLLAIGAIEERMLILVDIEKLMSSQTMGLVDGLAQ